jgi:hypothetical protein
MTAAPPLQKVRFPGRFAIALAAAFARDGSEIARAFQGLSNDSADSLGRELLDGLDLAARLSGDRTAWAFAANRVPWSYVRQAAADLQKSVDAWAVPTQRRRLPTPRRHLAGLAVRLVRGGVGGRALLSQLDAANATLPEPLDAEAVGAVAVWAAGAVQGQSHVTR